MATAAYQNIDILNTQEPRQILQMLWMNLRISKRFLLEAEAAYNGDFKHKGFASVEFNRAFRHLGHFTDNYLKMIVDAYVARLIIQGFQVGDQMDASAGTALDSPGDNLAWKIWKSNRLDQARSLAHREAMKFGNAHILIDPFTTVNGVPRVTVESPFHISVYQDPANRYVNAAALKHWQAADGFYYANLFTATQCLKYKSQRSYIDWTEAGLMNQSPKPDEIVWELYDEFPHDLGVCPVISIENQPTLTRGGVSDLESLLPLQRAIDNLCRNMLIASEYAAWPQKYALGIEQPKDADGNPMSTAAVEASLSRFWAIPPTSKEMHPPTMGAFPAADLQNYVTATEEIIHNMAMIASVPTYRLLGRLANLSASAILAAEAGFIDACRQKQTDYGAGWTSAMTLALNAAGNNVTVDELQVLWKDPSAVSGANLAASLVALQNVGVPQPVLWQTMGASPSEIERWSAYNKANPPPAPTKAATAESLKELTAHNSPNANAAADGMDDANSQTHYGSEVGQ